MSRKQFGKNSFFAHVVGLERKPYNDSIIFDIEFKIAPANAGVKGEDHAFNNGSPKVVGEIDKGNYAGMTASCSIWLTPTVSQDDAWKNDRYYKGVQSLGVVLEKDATQAIIPAEVELSDILGMPAIIHFDWVPDKKDPNKGPWNNCVGFSKWETGTRVLPQNSGDDLF